MQNKKIFGLTNEITIKNNILFKESRDFCDKYLNRENEIKIYQQLTTHNKNWYCIPYKWIKEQNFKSEIIFIDEAITLNEVNICINKMKSIIKIIKNLHELEMVEIEKFNPRTFLDFFIKNVGEIKALNLFKNKVNAIINNYWDDGKDAVFSHNDLVLKNFINFKKGWKLIDFEYACMNHYLFDFASFISESLPIEKHNKFINLLNLSSSEINKLNDLIYYQNFLWSYWAIYMFNNTKSKIFIDIFEEKLNNLKNSN